MYELETRYHAWESLDVFTRNYEHRLSADQLRPGSILYLIAKFSNPPDRRAPVCVYPGALFPTSKPTVASFVSNVPTLTPRLDIGVSVNGLNLVVDPNYRTLKLPVNGFIFQTEIAFLSEQREDIDETCRRLLQPIEA